MVSSFRKRPFPHSFCRDHHELIENDKLKLQLDYIAETLYRMTEAESISVHQNYHNDVKTDCNDRNIAEILHDTVR